MGIHKFWGSSNSDMGSRFKVEDDGLTVSFSALQDSADADIICLRADHPLPPRPFPPDDPKSVYFEMKIFETETQTDPDSKDSDLLPPELAIGLRGEFSDQSGAHVGWRTWTVGYHGDDGRVYEHNYPVSSDTGRKFGPGDTVGCGVDYSAEEYFFALRSEVIARRKNNIISRKMYPTVSQWRTACKIKVNFGDEHFLY
ncbi:uncharacterized protein BDZ99DRAFT_465114 [Mytilinidion resinicola]|uniref:B30.2/SPRY domain-containing protein n=1 Tax=Mytilinidion resinicola TaxID=574789 RepID=A0A6A6YH12_9PEZI|nr:uncharacterized protein BDZ99DRAFT_465114 [Mytilinidion resinicola]KAF2807187.1 hypothetical protein BDZ99DRAFT_465114 [Mytilinidion resinicola]